MCVVVVVVVLVCVCFFGCFLEEVGVGEFCE